MKVETVTPFAWSMKKTPIVIIPKMVMVIASQIIGPVQILTKIKKSSERSTAATAATITTTQAVCRS